VLDLTDVSVRPAVSAIKANEKLGQQVPDFLYRGGVDGRFLPKVSNHVPGCKGKLQALRVPGG